MMILLSPFCRLLRNGQRNPKEYPWWDAVVEQLNKEDVFVLQIGLRQEPTVKGVSFRYDEVPLYSLARIIREVGAWLSCDSFLPHLCHTYRLPNGVVVWGKSDPKIFGYDENVNLLRDRRCLRDNQFAPWEDESYDHRVFVRPSVVTESVLQLLKR